VTGRTVAVVSSADRTAVARACDVLRAGRIVGIPTETVYGLAVVPEPDPLRALIAAKGRAPDKGVALLIDDLGQASSLAVVPEAAARLAARLWPGPLTLVLPARADARVPEALTGGRPGIGLRMPDHPVPRAIARRIGPIAASSANRSGEPDARTAAALLDAVGEAVALVIDDGPTRGGVASTVVSVALDGSVTLLRVGALDEATIRDSLGPSAPTTGRRQTGGSGPARRYTSSTPRRPGEPT
jgi:L-threonylcarbamoyladenylate synthase